MRGFLRRVTGLDRAARLRTLDPPNLRSMWPHQIEQVRFLRSGNERLLADGMGLGKSAGSLRALPSRPRALVVTPAAVMQHWADQVSRWRPDLRPSEGKLRRPDESEALIVSWDQLRGARGGSRLIYEPMSDVILVADELDRAKNAEAMRTDAWRLLLSQCQRVWGLTGTPMPNNRRDLWGVLVSCRLDRALRMNWPRFRDLEADDVRELLSEVMLRRHPRDVFPSTTALDVATVTVAAPPDLRAFLDETRHDVWAKLDQGQIPPFEHLSEALAALSRSRIEPARAFATVTANYVDPLLVFSNHVEPVRAIGSLPGCASFDGETHRRERDAAIRAFQAGQLRALATTIRAGGVGLDLFAAGGVLFIDRTTVPAWNDQAIKRADRPGQKRDRLRVWHMVSDHPLDVRLQEILDRKEAEIRATVG